jgi:hypothetical protein
MQEAEDDLIGSRHTCLDGRAEKSAVANGPEAFGGGCERGGGTCDRPRKGVVGCHCVLPPLRVVDMVWAAFVA